MVNEEIRPPAKGSAPTEHETKVTGDTLEAQEGEEDKEGDNTDEEDD